MLLCGVSKTCLFLFVRSQDCRISAQCQMTYRTSSEALVRQYGGCLSLPGHFFPSQGRILDDGNPIDKKFAIDAASMRCADYPETITATLYPELGDDIELIRRKAHHGARQNELRPFFLPVYHVFNTGHCHSFNHL